MTRAEFLRRCGLGLAAITGIKQLEQLVAPKPAGYLTATEILERQRMFPMRYARMETFVDDNSHITGQRMVFANSPDGPWKTVTELPSLAWRPING